MTERFDEISNIDRIEFTLYGNDEIKRASAVVNDTYGINIAETYDLLEPKRGGLVDPRLGTADSTMLCATCGLEYKNCQGHFGHTELAEPVWHMGFINTVKSIMACICIRCSKLLINKSIDEINQVIRNKYGKVRFAEIKKLTSGIKYCQRTDYACGSPVPVITKKIINTGNTSGSILLQAETELSGVSEEDGGNPLGKKRVIEILKPKTVYNILKNVSDLDYQIMGFDTVKARPEDMIIINFPVPPIAIRPPAKKDFLSSGVSEDTLTHKLADIIKYNIKVRKLLDKEAATGEDMKYNDDYIRQLQYQIATYYNNEDINLPISQQKTGGRPTKSISERISGKTGRIRQNLNGKRVEGSGRAVITSDPTIGIDEVGIPLKIAMSIPFPEVVTPDNYEYLSKLVANGRDKYPGIIKIINRKGVSYDIRYRTRAMKIQFGDIVERHLVDGDYVLFNRQPSLHKLSMMGHKVKVSLNDKFTTFRMNPSACKPYNADFDGDEMNVFVPQTIQSVVELSMLANVTSLIISPRNTEPIIQLVQDGVLGSYLFTETNQPLTWNRVMRTLMNTENIDITKVPKKEMDTYELMSYLIPDINLSTKVKVEHGKFISGKVGVKTLNDANGFIGTIYDQYGGEITRDFIDNLQKVILSWLQLKGFTVGLKDCIIDDSILSKVREKTNKLMVEVKHLITEQENHPGLLDESIFEENIGTMLTAHAGNMGKIVLDSTDSSNNLFVMLDSGAKGKVEQLGSIASLVGQINMNNKRIAKKVNNRTLPHYHQFDDTPAARGFVSSSYVKGLRPTEFFFQQMANRDGLIDTAIKSVTGDTPIVIYENNVSKYVNIGDWIDNQLDSNKDRVEHYEEREMELLQLDNPIYIPTADADGNVTWGEITAITRHDPGKELYEIKTLSGKKVIVTESKSLLIYNNTSKQFERMSTPDVKLGHFVPVTMKLGKPPVITKQIDMSMYLSKSEYIYGTDFIKAHDAVANVMENREHIPSGWWESNNGKLFTLPYDSKARFQRATVRSNMDNIMKGYIYPFTTNREHSRIPDVFELNEMNGKFIGLFLAEGNVDVKSGYVGITNNSPNIQTFVKDWFDNWGLKSHYESHINNIGGTSSTIRGYSTILAKFLDAIIGHGAENKFVPDFAYSAPEEFIIGIINGYISGDGTITNNSIEVGSASSKLIDGISMLCTRLGIFGKVSMRQLKSNNIGTVHILPTYTLSIRAQWASKFGEVIPLMDEKKNIAIKEMEATKVHRNFGFQKDVVLDEITEINIIDVKKYPKVYDLTVPSTLNFGLANGLHVVDTADTGYIQRKFIKAMEDVMVYYDGIVRNSNNQIIQYFYGASNLDQIKQKPVKINIINMNDEKIRETLIFSKDELKKLVKNKKDLAATEKLNEDYGKRLIKYRDELRLICMKSKLNYNTIQDVFMLPVNLFRIINAYINKDSKVKSDLEYNDVLEVIKDIISSENTKLFCMTSDERKLNNNLNIRRQMEDNNKYLFIISIYEYLSPKKCINDYRFTKELLNNVKNDIIKSFNKAVVDSGEMVGILGAQSMGERTTQLNLNTKHSAGTIKKGTQGVMRMNEIMRCTKSIKTPILTIYLDKKYRYDKESAYKIASYISYLTLNDIVIKGDIGFDPDVNNGFLKMDKIDPKTAMQIYDIKLELKKLPWMFRFRINRDMLYAKKLKLFDIKINFVKFWRDKINNSKTISKLEKDVFNRVVNCAILTSNENEANPVIHIRFDLNNYDLNKIIELQDYILHDFNLKGLEGITGIDVMKQSQVEFLENGDIENKDQYILQTDGINMSGIRSITGIDHVRTITNDMYSIYANYGIEAVRNAIINEISELINNVNVHHISLLVDVMTHSGALISVDRNGINRQDTDPLSRASFERTMEQFLNAAAFNETDKLKSVSSRIIIGRMINGGTGYCNLMMDNDILENTEINVSNIEKGLNMVDNVIKLEENMLIDDLINKDSDIYVV